MILQVLVYVPYMYVYVVFGYFRYVILYSVVKVCNSHTPVATV